MTTSNGGCHQVHFTTRLKPGKRRRREGRAPVVKIQTFPYTPAAAWESPAKLNDVMPLDISDLVERLPENMNV